MAKPIDAPTEKGDDMRHRCTLLKYLLISALLAVGVCPAYRGRMSIAESRDIAPTETLKSAERLAREILDTQESMEGWLFILAVAVDG